MDLLIERITQFIERERLLSTGARVIIGLSGGADSVALLSLLHEGGYHCIAAHCNFHLRGEESNRDEKHAQAVAAQIGVPFIKTEFNVQEYIDNQPRPTSIEMACRELRYDWFARIRKEYKAEAIAVAHNSDDNIETMFLNIIRGTGLSGARGMQPLNNRNIIRPLLHTSREEIEQYLHRNKLPFITDSTNLQPIFRRNRLRIEVLPTLYDHFPESRAGITATLAHLHESEKFLRECIASRISPYLKNEDGADYIDIKSLAKTETGASYLLYEHLKNLGLSYSQAEDICRNPSRENARFPLSQGRELIMTNGNLYTVTTVAPTSLPSLESIFEITEHPATEFAPSRNGLEAYFDADLVDISRLYVRRWQPGDRLRPFGMKGSRAVSDIFNTYRIPAHRRSEVPILCLGEEILWVAPIRASRIATVTAQTKRFLKIRYKN